MIDEDPHADAVQKPFELTVIGEHGNISVSECPLAYRNSAST